MMKPEKKRVLLCREAPERANDSDLKLSGQAGEIKLVPVLQEDKTEAIQ